MVTTPEKLDLLLRGGWTDEVDRPLSLVIIDEAHNLGVGTRGLKLELLLATINREHRDSSFMLLTPFVPNAGGDRILVGPGKLGGVSARPGVAP